MQNNVKAHNVFDIVFRYKPKEVAQMRPWNGTRTRRTLSVVTLYAAKVEMRKGSCVICGPIQTNWKVNIPVAHVL
jgi:hypothetical protein